MAGMSGDRKTNSAAETAMIDKALGQQAQVVERGRRESQKRGIAHPIESHLAVDMREEIDGDAGANALFIALQEYRLEDAQLAAVHVEDDFVDDAAGQ